MFARTNLALIFPSWTVVRVASEAVIDCSPPFLLTACCGKGVKHLRQKEWCVKFVWAGG
jgi:hypothetical protein